MDAPKRSRRSFLLSSGGVVGSAWFALHASEIAAAAEHADHAATGPLVAAKFRFLTPAEAVQVDAIASQIIPSGATPGAHEARVVHFIDYALTTLFSGLAPYFRSQLAEYPGFASAGADEQRAQMRAMQFTPLFGQMRFLTVLGFLTSPKYGGNAQKLGWKAIGFEDRHSFTPPFGYYDANYKGFVPYPPKKKPA